MTYAIAILEAEKIKIEHQVTAIQKLLDQVRESEEEFDKGRWPILFERSGELFRQMVELDQAIEAA